MEEKILKYLSENKNKDTLDVCLHFKLFIPNGYSIVNGMIKKGLIRKEYIGIRTRLVLI